MPRIHSHTDYVACLPEPWRSRATAAPESTWWPWRGMTLHIARARKPDAAARLLILHGGGGNAAALWPVAALAAAQGWEVLAPDLPGYGRSATCRAHDGLGVLPARCCWPRPACLTHRRQQRTGRSSTISHATIRW